VFFYNVWTCVLNNINPHCTDQFVNNFKAKQTAVIIILYCHDMYWLSKKIGVEINSYILFIHTAMGTASPPLPTRNYDIICSTCKIVFIMFQNKISF
jgi:hypothetical protein